MARPVWLYRVVALALLLVQALRLNLVFNRYDVHPRGNRGDEGRLD